MLKKINFFCICFAFAASSVLHAQDSFIGEIKMFAGNFAPRGWAFCDGQLLTIAQNSAVFSVLGTTYGGDGRSTFAVPDLRGRVAINEGKGNGLQGTYPLGQAGGMEETTILPSNLPQHAHSIPALQADLKANISSVSIGNKSVLTTGNTANTTIATSISGASVPIYNVQPYLVVHYIICLDGIYPSRN